MDSGLNSCVLANNSEMILLPVNEPTFGTKRKSQIQTYLEQNEVGHIIIKPVLFIGPYLIYFVLCFIAPYFSPQQGEGVQHVALFTEDIFHTLELMRSATAWGGFEFMPGQGADYYQRVRERVGFKSVTEEQYKLAEEMGVLIDQDDQGVLLQIFTKPIGDRPTIFFEIIQVS